MTIHYLNDSNGNLVVQIPIKDWKKIKEKYPDIKEPKPDIMEIFRKGQIQHFKDIQNAPDEIIAKKLAKRFFR